MQFVHIRIKTQVARSYFVTQMAQMTQKFGSKKKANLILLRFSV